MSFFKAINFEALDDIQDNKTSRQELENQGPDATTTELQIENGYELYADAMRMYELGQYKESIYNFTVLISMDLFRMDNEKDNTVEDISDYLMFYAENSNTMKAKGPVSGGGVSESSDMSKESMSVLLEQAGKGRDSVNDADNPSEDNVADSGDHSDGNAVASAENEDTADSDIEEDSQKIIPDICDFTFSYRSEKLDTLRYLTFRNFAMLLYQYTSSELAQENPIKSIHWKNFVYVMKTILITALKCLSFQDTVSPDINLVDLILNFLLSFKSKKLTRNILELVLVENKTLINSKFLLPKWKRLVAMELVTLESIFDTHMSVSDVINGLILKEGGTSLASENKGIYSCPKVFQHLSRYVSLQEEMNKQQYNSYTEEIDVDFYRWNTLVSKIFGLVPSESCTYNFKKENPDPYNVLGIDETISKVVFKIKDEITMQEFQSQSNITHINLKSQYKTSDNLFSRKQYMNINMSNSNSDFINHLQEKRKRSIDLQEDTDADGINKKRVSQRVKNLTEDHQKELKISETQKTYLTNLNDIFQHINNYYPEGALLFLTSEDIESFEFVKKYGDFQLCLSDVYDCFSKWDKQLSEEFIGSKTKNVNDGSIENNSIVENILDKLFHALHDTTIENAPKLYNEGYYNFLKKINKGDNVHYQQVRLELLKTLMIDNYNKDSKCLINDFLWPTKMSYIIGFLVLCCQDQLLKSLNPRSKEDYLFAVSIYELLVDTFLKKSKDLNRVKHKSGDLFDNVQSLKEKIEAWNYLFFHSNSVLPSSLLDAKTKIRLIWCNLFYEKSLADDDSISLTEDFNEAKKLFDVLGTDFYVGNYNYTEIPPINFNTLQLLSIKDLLSSEKDTNSLSQLLKVLLDSDSVMHSTSDSNSWTYILTKFVKSVSNPVVKHEIWVNIFKSISPSDKLDFKLVDMCFLKILTEAKTFLLTPDYFNNDSMQRRLILLKLLNSLYELLETYNQFLLHELETLGKDALLATNISRNQFSMILELYALIYSPINYETIVQKELSKDESFFGKAKSSAKKWKDLLGYFSSFLSFAFDRFVFKSLRSRRDYLVAEFIKNQHFLLSEFECCDFANRNFLIYAQRTLFDISLPQYAFLLQQILHCNYGFTLSANVEAHKTQKHESIDPVDSYLLCNHIMKSYVKEDENLFLKLFKPSCLKTDIENIISFIPGNQYLTDINAQANRKALDEYLSMDLKYNVLLDTTVNIKIINTGTSYENVVKTKILTAAAINFLSGYYSRKRTGLDITSLFTGTHGSLFNTVENMIELLKTSIIFNACTFENWYLLGEVYNIIVEYELNSTCEKLNSQSKKDGIAENQKKAILCFQMSLKVFFKEPNAVKNYYHETLFWLYTKFGMTLYHAIELPMDRMAFICNMDGPVSEFAVMYDVSETKKTIKLKVPIVYYLAETYLTLGFNLIGQIRDIKVIGEIDILWILSISLSSIQRNLNRPFYSSIKHLMFACSLSLNYQKHINFSLTSLILNLFFNIECLISKGFQSSDKEITNFIIFSTTILMNYKSAFKTLDETVWNVSKSMPINVAAFKKLLLILCNGLINNDNNYLGLDYHERLLKCIISNDSEDYKSIFQTLKPIISVQSPVKPLINIQRNALEIPGYFFIYNSFIATFFLEALVKLEIFVLLPFVFKKLKRASNRIFGNIHIYEKYLNIYASHIQKKYQGLVTSKDLDMRVVFFILDQMISGPIHFEYLKLPLAHSEELDTSTEIHKDQIQVVYEHSPEDRFTDIIGIFEQRHENPGLYEKVALMMFLDLILVPYKNTLAALNKLPTDIELNEFKLRSSKSRDTETQMISKVSQILKKAEATGKLYKPSI